MVLGQGEKLFIFTKMQFLFAFVTKTHPCRPQNRFELSLFFWKGKILLQQINSTVQKVSKFQQMFLLLSSTWFNTFLLPLKFSVCSVILLYTFIRFMGIMYPVAGTRLWANKAHRILTSLSLFWRVQRTQRQHLHYY